MIKNLLTSGRATVKTKDKSVGELLSQWDMFFSRERDIKALYGLDNGNLFDLKNGIPPMVSVLQLDVSERIARESINVLDLALSGLGYRSTFDPVLQRLSDIRNGKIREYVAEGDVPNKLNMDLEVNEMFSPIEVRGLTAVVDSNAISFYLGKEFKDLGVPVTDLLRVGNTSFITQVGVLC